MWDLDNLLQEKSNSTEGIKPIIEEARKDLKKHTNGKVHLKFGQIKGINDTVAGLNAIATKLISSEIDDPEDVNTSDLKDAKELYSVTRYGFEIHNDSYKFRVFEANITPTYPIKIKVDMDIFEDEKERISLCNFTKNQDELVIENEDDFKKCFLIMINSRKVKYIISRMISI